MSKATAEKKRKEASDLVSDKMQQLLAAVGSKPAEDTTQIEASEYDWHEPRYFSGDQLSKLDDITKQVAAAVAERFAQLYNSDFNVTIASTTQHFAGELFEDILASGQNDYYLAFGTDQEHLFGFVGIPAQSAISWVTQLLGDSESETDPSTAFSDLEESLLLDIASAIFESLAKSLRRYGDIQSAGVVTHGQPPFELQGIEELCKIVFVVEQAAPAGDKQGAKAYILMRCSNLAPVVGRAVEANIKVSSQNMSEAILEHLQQTPVSITAQLASTTLTLEEVMSLRPHDVLLLDKAIDEPVELIVEGQVLFHGRPARLAGQHAVVITQASWDTVHNIDLVAGA